MKKYTNSHHNYTFEEADTLVLMGSSWFVSRLYSEIDKKHDNWKRVKTWKTRERSFYKSKDFHSVYIRAILHMDVTMLQKNTIGLSGEEVLTFAREIKSKKGW